MAALRGFAHIFEEKIVLVHESISSSISISISISINFIMAALRGYASIIEEKIVLVLETRCLINTPNYCNP